MDEFPFAYERINVTNWAYTSSLLMLALFFKFNRFWSVRNLDLLLVILLAPGLLMIEGGDTWVANQKSPTERATENSSLKGSPPASEPDTKADADAGAQPTTSFDSATGSQGVAATGSRLGVTATGSTLAVTVASAMSPSNLLLESSLMESAPEPESGSTGYSMQQWGYCWLMGVGMLFLIRLLVDASLVRRPLLDPNLSMGGLVFLGASLMVFLFANIITSDPTPDDLRGARDAIKMIQRQATGEGEESQLARQGPGYRLFSLLPVITTFDDGEAIMETDADGVINIGRYVIVSKSLAIASQLLIVMGIVFFCYRIYGSFYVGVGVATIYLMVPYTAIYTGHVIHSLPAALMIWALVFVRKPWVSGILIGLATGVTYYPIFLLPLWISFYWLKGARRFISGVSISLAVCILGLALTSTDPNDFVHHLRAMFGFWWPKMDGLSGIWALGWDHWYRMPILVAFIALCVSFVSWPPKKDLGTLVSYSAAVMVAVQFWHGFGGGLYLAWYLPMALLAFFRPNMSGRVATEELAG